MAAVALASSRAADAPPSHEAAAKPRLIVVLVADGLSWDRLNRSRPWLSRGLRRLLDEGAVSTGCNYDHLNTETAPGHASIMTGAPPRVHGVPLNQWYAPSPDGKAMAEVYSVTQTVGGAPGHETTMQGPAHLRVPTLGDRMTAKDPRAKVVSISNKDRAAIMLAGRDPQHAAYWYSSKDGVYVTSPAFDAASPTGGAVAKVVAKVNADAAGSKLAEHLGTIWSILPTPDGAARDGYETGLGAYQDTIVGPAFPHDIAAGARPLPSALLWSPEADALLADLAIGLLADDDLALGRDDVPDLLAISFSANDYVSHYYGPESLEDLETLRGLDVTIGRLLDALDARVGRDRVVVALSADHGFMGLPEALKRSDPAGPASRVPDAKIVDDLNDAVNRALSRKGGPPLVYKLESCSLWLDRVALAAPGAPSASRVLSIVDRELKRSWRPVIEKTFVLDAGWNPSRNDLARRAWNAVVPGRSGDMFVVARPGVLIDLAGKGTSHGSPWEYDTHVPLVFWGSGIAPSVTSTPTTPYDIAPTLASRIGIDLPDATGHALLGDTPFFHPKGK